MKIKKGDWFRCIKNDGEIQEKQCYQTVTDDRIKIHTNKGCYMYTGSYIDYYFKKLYTIQDLKDGKVAIKNDGTKVDLLKVIEEAFPSDYPPSGAIDYYHKSSDDFCLWTSTFTPDMPTQSVKEFLVQLDGYPRISISKNSAKEWKPKVGEIVEAKEYLNSYWKRYEFLATSADCYFPHAVVERGRNSNRIISVIEIRKANKTHSLTRQEIADYLGIPVGQMEIVS